MVNWLLAEQNMEMADISHVFISAGPGSYTGLRIGFSFVRGLIYANKTKLIPVPTPEIYAHKRTKEETDEYSVLAIMDARRNEIYVSEYSYKKNRKNRKHSKNILTEIEPVKIVTIENFLEEYTSRTVRIAGSGLSIIKKHLEKEKIQTNWIFPEDDIEQITAIDLFNYGRAILKAGTQNNYNLEEPLYVRDFKGSY